MIISQDHAVPAVETSKETHTMEISSHVVQAQVMNADKINEIFTEWNEQDLSYCLLRGWNGNEIVGSDIDILVSSASFEQLGNVLIDRGFTENRRGILFLDFFANERYFDRTKNHSRVRFHVTDTLVFGKLTRKIRFPYENAVLDEATYNKDKNAKTPSPEHSTIIDVIRTVIDKPDRLPERTCIDSEALLENTSLDCNAVLSELVAVYNAACEQRIKPKQAQAKGLSTLKQLEGSEYKRRKIQRLYADLLITGYRKTVKRFR